MHTACCALNWLAGLRLSTAVKPSRIPSPEPLPYSKPDDDGGQDATVQATRVRSCEGRGGTLHDGV